MLNFKLVSPENKLINHSELNPKAKINGEYVSTHSDLARYIWARFKKWSQVQSLEEWKQGWADSNNENLEDGRKPFTAENIDILEAFDHCNNNFILNIDGNVVDIFDFLTKNLPIEKQK